MAVADVLLADGNQGRKKVDDAFEVGGAAAWARPLVMQRVEAMIRFGIKDDEVLLTATEFCILDPIERFLGFCRKYESARVRNSQETARQLLAACGGFPGAGRAANESPF